MYLPIMAIEKVTTKITANALARLRRISEKTGEKMYAILERLLWDEEINVNARDREKQPKGKK